MNFRTETKLQKIRLFRSALRRKNVASHNSDFMTDFFFNFHSNVLRMVVEIFEKLTDSPHRVSEWQAFSVTFENKETD